MKKTGKTCAKEQHWNEEGRKEMCERTDNVIKAGREQHCLKLEDPPVGESRVLFLDGHLCLGVDVESGSVGEFQLLRKCLLCSRVFQLSQSSIHECDPELRYMPLEKAIGLLDYEGVSSLAFAREGQTPLVLPRDQDWASRKANLNQKWLLVQVNGQSV